MPLQKTTAAVALHDGLETKNDPKQVVAGKMLALSNGVFTSPGSIGKRNGTAAIGSALPGGAGRFLTQFNGETIASDGQSLFSWNSAGNSWTNRGLCRSVGVSRTPVSRTRLRTNFASSAVNAGLICYAYAGKAQGVDFGVYYTIVDLATGSVVVSDQLVEATTLEYSVPRVFALGSNFLFIYQTSAATGSRYVSVSNPSVVSGFTTIAASGGGIQCDCVSDPVVNRVYVSWAITTNAFCGYFATAGTFVGGATQAAGANVIGLGIFADAGNGNVVVMYQKAGAGQLYYWGITSALATAWAPVLFDTSGTVATELTGYMLNGTGTLFYSVLNPPVYGADTNQCPVVSGTPGAPAVFKRGLTIYSKPFAYAGTIFMVLQYVASGNAPFINPIASYFLIDSTGYVAARIAQEDGVAGWVLNGTVHGGAPEVTAVSASVFSFAIIMASKIALVGVGAQSPYPPFAQYTAGVDSVTLDMSNTSSGYSSGQIANSLLISGGMLQMYDGRAVVEQGFHYPPWYVSATLGAGGGLSAGLYQWTAVYEWADGQGVIHQSAPSQIASPTATATQAATITVPTLRLTAKNSVIIRIYRTQVNGSVFYMVNETDPVLNDPTVDTLTYVDTKSDTQIAVQPLLYTQQQVPATPGPPCSALVVYRNRVVLVASEQPTQLWYSLQVIPGQPAQMSDQFIQNVDSLGGSISALGVMDDKLMIGKPNTWMYMTGDGPDALGNNNTFSQPLVIDAASGCSVPSSVVMTDKGLMYQSAKGIRMIDRGLQENYIGEGVEGLLGAQPVIAASIIPTTSEVRFHLGNGVVLVWDYFLNQWASFTYPYGAVGDASVSAGVYAFISSAGQVYSETPGTYSDNGAVISTSFTTSWLQLASLQGFQRVYKLLVLGDYYSAHTLTVQIAVDFDPTIVQTDVVTASAPEQFRFFMSRQKCQAMQVTISDNPTVVGKSMALSGLTFEVGIKSGPFRLPATKSFG